MASIMISRCFAGLVMSLVLVSLVSGYSVTTFYHDERVLEMYAGESKDVVVVLSNSGGEDELNLRVEVTESEIATGSRSYTVDAGGRVEAMIEVSIPRGADVGQEYEVEVSIAPEEDDSGGQVQLAIGYTKEIPVRVIEKPEGVEEESDIGMIVLIVGILIVLAIIVFLVLKRGKRENVVVKGKGKK